MIPEPHNPSATNWEYGKLRSSHSWVAWVLLASGLLALPLSWLMRNELELGRNPLPPWAVLLVGTILSCIGLVVSITLLRGRSRPAKRIVLADGKLSLPGGLLTGSGWTRPVSDIAIKRIDLGFVNQMQLSAHGKRTTLSSALFASDSEFERLYDMLNRSK